MVTEEVNYRANLWRDAWSIAMDKSNMTVSDAMHWADQVLKRFDA